jgi:hypothetical protein
MLAVELPPGISLGEYTSLAMEAVKPLGRLCALGECSFRPVNISEEPSQILFRPPQQGEVQRSNCGLCDCRSRIGGIGNHRLGFSSLPFCETSDHILSGPPSPGSCVPPSLAPRRSRNCDCPPDSCRSNPVGQESHPVTSHSIFAWNPTKFTLSCSDCFSRADRTLHIWRLY